jgi:hypothetical protein
MVESLVGMMGSGWDGMGRDRLQTARRDMEWTDAQTEPASKCLYKNTSLYDP